MQQSVKKKLSLLLITLVLSMGLLCASYGAFRFTGMFWYPHRSSVKDVDVEIITSSSPNLLCLEATSWVVTEDQVADVGNWYRQQGRQISETSRRCHLLWQPLPRLYLGPVEIGSMSQVSAYRRADHRVTDIYTESSLCVSW